MGNNQSSDGPDKEEPLNLVLLGDNNKGKSLVGDAILGRNVVRSWHVNQCVKVQEKVNGRLVTVVQTPIWTGSLHTTPATVQGEIKRSMAHCSDGPLAFVLVVSIESDFTWESRVAVEEHMGLISSSVWEYTFLLLITDKQERQRDPTDTHFINQRRDKKNLTWLLDKCGGRCFVFNRIDCNKEQVRDFMLQTHDVVKEHDQIHQHFRSVERGQQKRIEELEARVAVLETELIKLKNQNNSVYQNTETEEKHSENTGDTTLASHPESENAPEKSREEQEQQKQQEKSESRTELLPQKPEEGGVEREQQIPLEHREESERPQPIKKRRSLTTPPIMSDNALE